MGMWIAILIVLFVLGSAMALKPSGIDLRLDKLRMTAWRLQLNPKLVACPDWLPGRDNEHGRGMMGQYCLILEDSQLPYTRYRVIDGQWRPDTSFTDTAVDNSKLTIPSALRSHNNGHQSSRSIAIRKTDFSLDKTALDLPISIEPFVKGLLTKANSIIIYWEDIAYVRPATNPSYQTKLIEQDLLALKLKLEQWAEQLKKSPSIKNSMTSNSDSEHSATNNHDNFIQ